MKTKNTMVLIILASTILVVACKKGGMMNSNIAVDVNKYGGTLSNDYSKALENHISLITEGVTTDVHEAHHNGTSSASPYDPGYLKLMFNRNDSLFSGHFYEFCLDMMQNSGMMGKNDNMMGGSTNMMNGNAMDGTLDMSKMMSYMDSLHKSDKTMMNPDYLKTDSLIFGQMDMCNMMVSQTDTIKSVYVKMQTLRKNHKTLHGN